MRFAGLAVAVTLAACGPDTVPFDIALSFDRSIEGRECPSDSCMGFPQACEGVVSLRIFDASDGTLLHSECERLPGMGTLCSLRDLDLGSDLLPNTMVEIQMAIWPYVESLDPRIDTSRCPAIEFDLDGGYVPGEEPTPALAGRTFFPVGSSATAPLTLGCINADALDAPSCVVTNDPQISAIVRHFDTYVEVLNSQVDRLTVSVARPNGEVVPGSWIIRSTELVELTPRITGTAVWEGDYPFGFTDSACIQVLSDDLGAAAAVRCYSVAGAELDAPLAMEGILLDDDVLDAIQQALGGEPLPNSGIVVGKVLDQDGAETAGVEVTVTFGTVQYLSDDLKAVGGTRTSSSGVFVSTDAPFKSEEGATNYWTGAHLDGRPTVNPVIGGRIIGKVSVVILQLAPR